MIILLAVSIGACSEKEGPPQDILSKEQFTHLLIEIHLIEAKIDRIYVEPDSAKALFDYFQGLLLKEEGIDTATFNRTLSYYKNNPKPFMKVYEAVTDSLLELEAKGKLSIREDENEDDQEGDEEQLSESDSTLIKTDSVGSSSIKSKIKMKRKGKE